MINSVIALTVQGYPIDSDPVKKGLEAIERFSWEDSRGFRIQPCVSPVWDTALSVSALVDSGTPPDHPKLKGAVRWVMNRQLLSEQGDWKIYRPHLISGGWSFEYYNSWYPDVDDTAAVILGMLKQDPSAVYTTEVKRAAEWIAGMQNRDGGWAAFDVNNDKQFLNEIPFSDMDSLCDLSCPDITGRILEAFGFMEGILRRSSQPLPDVLRKACQQGVDYLRRTQESEGSWFGRWGVNYIYGTSNVLCGLSRVPISGSDEMILRALRWLRLVQNRDGGWGERVDSYLDRRWMGIGESTASQTAWALMGLLSYFPATDPAIEKGVQWLVSRQIRIEDSFDVPQEGGNPIPAGRGGTWEEDQFTGTGFPKHFYLKYHYYRHYFPLMALGRYLSASES
jgi:squalene-hopene/tetraprenyl-beta-curcumene cyclase